EADMTRRDRLETFDIASHPNARPRDGTVRGAGQWLLGVRFPIQTGQFGAEGRDFWPPLRQLQLPLAMDYAGEGGLQAVEIFLRDRIEFVIVAAGAAYRHSQESGAGGGDHVGEVVLSLLELTLHVGDAD